MKILLIGGHMTPALAVIQELQKEDCSIVYVGRKHSMEGDTAVSLEYQTIRHMGIKFVDFRTGRLQRKFTRHTFFSLIKIPRGFIRALALVKKEKPDVVVGFGGYLSVPICYAARILRVPIVIHEQTLEAGLANRMIAPFADAICISWESSQRFFPKNKTILTGNPIIKQQPTPDVRLYQKLDEQIPLIVIVGGSQGSHAINMLVREILPALVRDYQVIHQTGDASEFQDFDKLSQVRRLLPIEYQKRYTPVKFIAPGDIETVWSTADLVVSRAGINTVTQLLMLNKLAIFIPLSVSQHNEQYKNALMAKEAGLAHIYQQEDITPDRLLQEIHDMLSTKKHITSRLAHIREVHTHAPRRVIAVIQHYAQKSSTREKTQTA